MHEFHMWWAAQKMGKILVSQKSKTLYLPVVWACIQFSGGKHFKSCFLSPYPKFKASFNKIPSLPIVSKECDVVWVWTGKAKNENLQEQFSGSEFAMAKVRFENLQCLSVEIENEYKEMLACFHKTGWSIATENHRGNFAKQTENKSWVSHRIRP